ncbi:Two component regulator propeller [Ekhidna lutea]|uniref:Two component regulator propeller n=1 Tax=Ekhidna lutea TaxID=447679 RepID=A0A239J4C2_EKHLU|nr:sensor histidine kinase [Ekhidna lutea]SNT00876.1 Two component regulator propeller [Ekhidna lutea]
MRSCLLIAFILLTSASIAQYRFDHLTVNDGLAQNSINDIYQDSEGFMWFATQDGLSRYDGYTFVNYTPDGLLPVADNFLWDIVEDKNGNIWSASRDGVTRLNWKENKVTHFKVSRSSNISRSQNQSSGLFSTREQMILSFMDGTYRIPQSLFPDSVQVILTDEYLYYEDQSILGFAQVEGEEILITPTEVIQKNQRLAFPEGHFKSLQYKDFLLFDDLYWIATNNGILTSGSSFEGFNLVESTVGYAITSLSLGPDKVNLWVGTDKGILILDPKSRKIIGHILAGSENDDLSTNNISEVFESKDGLTWIGTANGGLNIYDSQKDRFRCLTKRHIPITPPIWSIFKTDEELLLGVDNGLYRIELTGDENAVKLPILSKAKKISHSYLDTRITAVTKLEADKFLIGTFNGKLGVLDGDRVKMIPLTLKEGSVITDIEITKNAVWVTTYQGIIKLDRELNQTGFDAMKEFDLPTNYFLSVFQSDDETLWFAGNTGFFSFSEEKGGRKYPYNESNLEKSPAFNFITGFFEDVNGRIWISTFGGGVSRLDRNTDTFKHFQKKDGLSNNVCSAIEGNDKYVFVSTNNGINRIDIESGEITGYCRADGLIDDEFAICSSFSDQDEFYFGGVSGLSIFNSKDLEKNNTIPKPVITNLAVNYKDQPLARLSAAELDLFPEDKIFSFEFSPLTFRKRNQLEYEYKMSGFDNQWVLVPASQRIATYSLPPNSYEFQVRTVDGNSRSEITRLSIVVHPAFYQTWWFITLSLIVVILLIIFVVRYYSHQSLKERLRKLEIQQKIQSERERISRDLHDNVGSQITYIASSIDHLSGNGSSDDLKELGEYARDTMRQLRETIWVINHDEVTLDELKSKVIEYLADVLQFHSQIVHEVNFESSDLKLKPSDAINLFRIIQEAVNNIIKHAKASKIEIQLNLNEGNQLIIADNGVGFIGNSKDGHFGLINMKGRAAELGADFQLITKPKAGTTIKISGFQIGQMT